MSSVRNSTLAHMNRLIAAASLVGTVACNRCNSLPGGGYAVVDPMPNPARCPSNVYGMSPTAKLVTTDAGQMQVEVELTSPPGLPPPSFDADDAGALSVAVSNGTLDSQSRSGTTFRFLVTPAKGVGAIALTLQVTCDAGSSAIVANVDWGTTADGGKDVRIRLSEY